MHVSFSLVLNAKWWWRGDGSGLVIENKLWYTPQPPKVPDFPQVAVADVLFFPFVMLGNTWDTIWFAEKLDWFPRSKPFNFVVSILWGNCFLLVSSFPLSLSFLSALCRRYNATKYTLKAGLLKPFLKFHFLPYYTSLPFYTFKAYKLCFSTLCIILSYIRSVYHFYSFF